MKAGVYDYATRPLRIAYPVLTKGAAATRLSIAFAAIGFLIVSGAGWSQSRPTGLPPRPAPSDYPASQGSKVGTFAASLVPVREVKRAFAVDISNSYLVVEVAYYPHQAGAPDLNARSFLLKTSVPGADYMRPVDAGTIASVMEERNAPRRSSSPDTVVHTAADIGYGSETDPYTGRRVHSVYTGAEAGVGTGNYPAGPPMPPPPGSTPQDRMELEQELEFRALPSGNFTAPVAGFLYFPASKKSKSGYTLEYVGDDGTKVLLSLSPKPH